MIMFMYLFIVSVLMCYYKSYCAVYNKELRVNVFLLKINVKLNLFTMDQRSSTKSNGKKI